MTRIRIGAAALGLALLLGAGAARAQETTGRVTGRVTDQETGLPLGGVTVIVAGPQGEDAVITSDKGEYSFTTLPVGTYVIRFYAANTSTQVEQPGVIVAAEKTVRVNAKISAAAATAAQQTYVIASKAPTIDIGSARIESNFDEKFMNNVPVGRTYGDVIERAPGAFVDGSGNVSIGGATGLENIYLVNGLNVTGMRFGNLESGASSIGGGSNLPLEFLSQIGVNSGGYQAEYGGAMGGVVNTVLRSGSNEFHGSAFGYWSPYWLAANPNIVQPIGSALAGVRKRDFDDSIGAEVGGPIIKDKLFFWVGFAPRITDTHVLRLTYAQQEDPNNPGQPLLGANGLPVTNQTDWTARIPETHRTYYYAGTLDWLPLPENKLTLSIVGTPSFNNEVKSQYGINSYCLRPRTAVESLTKANTDVSAHWVSKLLERRWQIDVLAGMHNEYFYDRSPDAALNSLNEVQYGGANLWDLEHATGCQHHRGRLPALPGQPVLPGRWLRQDREVLRLPLDGRNQVDAHHRGGRPQRAQVRLAPRAGNVRPHALLLGTGGRARLLADLPARQPERRPPLLLQHHDVLRARARRNPGHAGPGSRRRDSLQGPARLHREEPVERLLPAGQLQPQQAPQSDHQRRAPAGAAEALRQQRLPPS